MLSYFEIQKCQFIHLFVPINQRMINRKFRLVYCLTSLPMELLLKIKKQFKVLPDVHRFENEHTTKSVSLSP